MTLIIDQNDVGKIVDALKNDQVVAFPTETVYGLAVRYNSYEALSKLVKAKNRDISKAITLMLDNPSDIQKYAEVSLRDQQIIDAYMPGKITLIFNKKEAVDSQMTSGRETIGIRIPDSSFVLSVIGEAGPLLVTSANISGGKNTTSTKEVLEQLDGRIDMIVDGQTSGDVASTVVDLTDGHFKILREGTITKKDIERVLK